MACRLLPEFFLMLARLYYTLRPLKWRQWWYRAAQPVTKKLARRRIKIPDSALAAACSHTAFKAVSLPVHKTCFPSEQAFRFLNITQYFEKGIDWNQRTHGLLWLFNLHYFEWLYDDTLTVDERLQTMRDYARRAARLSIAQHPYPASLRVVAWVRFLLRFDIKDELLLHVVYADADRICRFPEYALDGNHLWENGVALLSAGAFFRSQGFLQKGAALLQRCIYEQLYGDGGHKEGRPDVP